eukprot:gene22650-29800_t
MGRTITIGTGEKYPRWPQPRAPGAVTSPITPRVSMTPTPGSVHSNCKLPTHSPHRAVSVPPDKLQIGVLLLVVPGSTTHMVSFKPTPRYALAHRLQANRANATLLAPPNAMISGNRYSRGSTCHILCAADPPARSRLVILRNTPRAAEKLGRSGVLPNSSLISLDISGCQLIADQCGQLAHILAASQNLQRLILDDNRMSEKALQPKTWAEILPSLRHLRELHLGGSSNSQLGSQGASALGHSLATAPSLSVLSVVACGLHDGSMSGFAAAALNQHRLTMLNLSNNQIGRIGSAELLGAVAQRPTSAAPLQVDLSGNPLPTDSQQLWQLRRQALAVQQAGSKGIQD